MRKLVRFLKDYKKECVIGPLFKFLEACFELIVPLITAVSEQIIKTMEA